jgi:DNA polymerase-3 subunit delta'
MTLPWLHSLTDSWKQLVQKDRVPHAILLSGAPGVGKRCLAGWIARERLGISGAEKGPQYPLVRPEHADLRWISILEDKKTIGIEQIRTLVADLGLTSYEGGGKVAIIEPANAMTVNAANSLLKTLEEPAGEALLILVADRMGKLPATILSRCQRLNVPVPPLSVSLSWLDQRQPATGWRAALELVGQAPLGAIDAIDQLDLAAAMLADFSALPSGQESPIEVAARWAKYEPEFCLEWLSRTLFEATKRASGGAIGTNEGGLPDSVLRYVDRRNLFCYLDIINRLRSQAAGSFNVQLTLESLLIDWAGGLKDCHRSFYPGEELPVAHSR